ncbi:MAG: lipase maturation factor family protein, partial [Myxococcota bacterium]
VFLRFQWDILLLETGFLALLFAPWTCRPRLDREPPPSRIVRVLLGLLLFRLMFSSGIVKLLDDNPVGLEWHRLTALSYHFQTQCLPNPVAWLAHQLPAQFLKLSVLAMFCIEIGVPFLFFLPRRARILAFFLQALLQLLIIVTGNYGFFNWLTLALCIPLLDDAFVRRFLPRRLREIPPSDPQRAPLPRPQKWVIVPLALILLVLNAAWMADTLRSDRRERIFGHLPHSVRALVSATAPFQLVNPYGLFRSMTTRRPEIIIEGSDDGHTWQPYEFKYKPGPLDRPPPFVAPHQPRLDWQMWFAALGDLRSPHNRWFLALAKRLLEGSPDVLDLLETNPFPDRPPRFLRAELFDYRFTTWAERLDEGHWWRRTHLRSYLPPVTLERFRRGRQTPP